MVLFNRVVTCEKDTNVHGAYPDWYDGGKTTLTVGGPFETSSVMKFSYAELPYFGAGELHSAKLLVYPTAITFNRETVESKRFKIYKLNKQLETEGSLDAVTTDLIVGSSFQPNDNINFLSERFLGRDTDGDGNPDLGTSIHVTAYERITKTKPYITVDEAINMKDSYFDSFYMGNKGEGLIKKHFAEKVAGQWRIYVETRNTNFSWGARWYPVNKHGKYNYGRLPGYNQHGRLSFSTKQFRKADLPHFGESTTTALKADIDVTGVATSDTTFFDKVRYSDNIWGGTSERLG
jgi:hypothetical protein